MKIILVDDILKIFIVGLHINDNATIIIPFYVVETGEISIKIIKEPLTKTASRKKRKMEEIARQEREAKAIRFFTGTFRSLATKDPKGHVGFLGNIWPVKK